MRHGVVADEVPGSVHSADDLGALVDEVADHEERGADVVAREDFEELHRGGVVGSVVIGEGDLVGIPASDESAAEELRLRRERGVSQGSAGRDG